MNLSNAHYYAHHRVFGEDGDFITAPEISQIFGECIAFWIIQQCDTHQTTFPHIVEVGPGRGTLMQDILRILKKTKLTPSIHMVETSLGLRELQKQKIGDTCTWHDDLTTLPQGFTLFIGNEFFDALPIQQYQNDQLIHVGFEKDVFVFIPKPAHVREFSPLSLEIANTMAQHLHTHGGGALIVDYGDYTEGMRECNTLQAVLKHTYIHPLAHLGEADLTAHVDFKSLAEVFLKSSLRANFMTQGEFLIHYGFDLRLKKLMDICALETEKRDMKCRALRLIDPQQMGTLFKVLEIPA